IAQHLQLEGHGDATAPDPQGPHRVQGRADVVYLEGLISVVEPQGTIARFVHGSAEADRVTGERAAQHGHTGRTRRGGTGPSGAGRREGRWVAHGPQPTALRARRAPDNPAPSKTFVGS